jgi:hypothetical protein
VVEDGLIDWEHDDHADVHVARDADAAEFFLTLEECSSRVLGFATDISVKVKGRGEMVREMGTGVYIESAAKNLMSAVQLRKEYTRVPTDGGRIKYVHNRDSSSITFRLEKDGYFHTRLEAGVRPTISGVDFYNPPALKPVEAERAAETWGMIYATERLHWATNHANAGRMKEMCSDPTYVGDVTAAGIDMFYAHRGCSSCVMGTMRHHDQLSSGRGKSDVVGHTVQGDFFYVEAGLQLVPTLLLVDEASSFIFMYAFVGCNLAKAKRTMCTKPQFKRAIAAMIGVWRKAGRTCREIRFDREGLVVAPEMQEWLGTQGIRLMPTAADHKLGFIEVHGRIVKDGSRAVVCGIRERFGYLFPKVYFPLLAGDVCALLNRTRRGDAEASGYAMMFGLKMTTELDVQRDLRVAIGEIVL